MKWVKGGVWEDRGMFAEIVKVAASPDDTQAGFPGSFLVLPKLWQSWVGIPYGLTEYDVTDSIAAQILQGFAAFHRQHASAQHLWMEGGDEGARAAAARDLCEMLVRWGPLFVVPGLLELESLPRPIFAGEREVLWLAYHSEVWRLGSAWDEIQKGYRTKQAGVGRIRSKDQRRSLFEWIRDTSAPALHELSAIPELVKGAVQLTPSPLTLRAYLWIHLLPRLADHSIGVCRHCGAEFQREQKRGRPFVMCPEHRTNAFHQAVFHNRAPARQLLVGSEDDDR